MYTSLESVQIINNVLLFQDENSWSQFDDLITVGALSLTSTEGTLNRQNFSITIYQQSIVIIVTCISMELITTQEENVEVHLFSELTFTPRN